jgi:glycerol-3-phosphate O-acyltransferase
VKPQDKERVKVEVVQRVLDGWSRDARACEQALFDTLYFERRRLETERNRKLRREQTVFYERIQARALKAGLDEQRELLKRIIRFFADEVAGHFDERVYHLATRAVPVGLNLLLNALSPLNLIQQGPGGLSRLDDQLVITGQTAALKRLAGQGTTVLLPTHSSNLDSILVGYMLYRLGLPPYTYGAGLNLFSNKLIGFFMHHLGAYKVDRRKQAPIYKDVLKTYAGCTMELGYHNLFFPGGTRSRSGAVEQRLKKGLLGEALRAYINNLAAGKPRPDVFVVPCTINYQLVLEAETLIDDYLKEVGKSRYIIDDDEFSKPKRVFEFVSQLFSLESRIHLVLSQPLDVFGNPVDEDGTSRDARGRPVERRRYVEHAGRPVFDAQRDREYTRELGESVAAAYRRDVVLKPIHVLSDTVFSWLRERNPEMDIYRLLRTGGAEDSMPLTEAYRRAERTLVELRRRADAGGIRLAPSLQTRDTVKVFSQALSHLKSYHRRPALERRGDRLHHIDRNLLLYYGNRLSQLRPGPQEASV